ncbi:MAG TPA: lipoprotein-releasing ABC transporter permease subunit [Phenylobacterium sp.]
MSVNGTRALEAPGAAPFSGWERRLAFRYLRARRSQGGVALISIISFIGIMLAVSVLIIVMSVMNGFRAELLSRVLGVSAHVYVAGGVLTNPGHEATAAKIRAVPGVAQVTPVVEAQALAMGQGQITGAVVRGVSAADLKATKLIASNIVSGGLRDYGKGEYGGDLIIVGERLAGQLGVRAGDPLTLVSPSGGATAFGSTVQKKTYTVAATFTVGVSEYDQAFIYMPLEQAQIFFGREPLVDVIEVKLDHPDRAPQIKPAIQKAVGPAALVTDWTQRNASFWDALKIERNVMRLILMLIVAIATLNIISGLVMLVKNKGRDIAILRTMGAGQGAIMRIFLMAGASVGVLGTAAGLAIGVIFCTFIGQIQGVLEKITGMSLFSSDVYYLSHLPAKIDWAEVAAIIGFALGMSLLVTLYPSWRASRIDPVEALRYE